MRVLVIALALVAGLLPAAARDSGKPAAIPSPRATYAAMPQAERVALQSDLIWSGDYDGIADGEISDEDIAAIRSFQKHNRSKQTGVLNPQEREILAAKAKTAREAVAWRVIDDTRSGIRVGVPSKILSQSDHGKTGTRWTSVHGEAVLETFRIKETGITLAAVFDQQKKEPQREIEFAQLRSDTFFIWGLQGLKRFFVRARLQGDEVRGITVRYDQAINGTMAPLLQPIWSAFVPFPTVQIVATPKKLPVNGKVEYGTGIIVSSEGHIITPRHIADRCESIVAAGLGHADHVADDQTGNIALLRVYGGRELSPLPFSGPAASGRALTVIGVSEPQAQGGASTPSVEKTQLGGAKGTDTLTAIDPPPVPGFSGAVAIDADRHFAGMVQLKPQLLAGAEPGSLPPPATLISADAVRTFLAANNVHPVVGNSGVSEAKAAAVRVICVRK